MIQPVRQSRLFSDRLMVASLVAALCICSTAKAQALADGSELTAVTVGHLDLHPRSPAIARRTLERLGEAAMEACGAADSSLDDMKRAVRASPCWRAAMARAVRRIDDPRLALAYAQAR